MTATIERIVVDEDEWLRVLHEAAGHLAAAVARLARHVPTTDETDREAELVDAVGMCRGHLLNVARQAPPVLPFGVDHHDHVAVTAWHLSIAAEWAAERGGGCPTCEAIVGRHEIDVVGAAITDAGA
jgi:hypothetical protein